MTALILLAACPAGHEHKKDDDHKKDDHHKEARKSAGGEEHEPLPKRVRLLPTVIQNARVRTTIAAQVALSTTVSLPGEIAAHPDRSARVAAPAAGRVDRVMFREGEVLRKGQPLVTIRVPELGKIKGAYAVLRARLGTAQTNATRLEALWKQRLAPEQAFLDARAAAAAIEAEARSLRTQLMALGTGTRGAAVHLTVRAPIAGVVVSRDAIVGQPVTAEQALASISDLSQVWFLGRVFEKDLWQLRVGAAAEVELNAYPNERFRGTVSYIGQQVDPIARTLTARIHLRNRAGHLRIGLFGTARIVVAHDTSDKPTLAVPRTALTEIEDKPALFVRLTAKEFEWRTVTLGRAAAAHVEVLSGLRVGEAVVTEGVFTLKSVVLKGTIAEDHH